MVGEGGLGVKTDTRCNSNLWWRDAGTSRHCNGVALITVVVAMVVVVVAVIVDESAVRGECNVAPLRRKLSRKRGRDCHDAARAVVGRDAVPTPSVASRRRGGGAGSCIDDGLGIEYGGKCGRRMVSCVVRGHWDGCAMECRVWRRCSGRGGYGIAARGLVCKRQRGGRRGSSTPETPSVGAPNEDRMETGPLVRVRLGFKEAR